VPPINPFFLKHCKEASLIIAGKNGKFRSHKDMGGKCHKKPQRHKEFFKIFLCVFVVFWTITEKFQGFVRILWLAMGYSYP
jgi:hypothetical protein